MKLALTLFLLCAAVVAATAESVLDRLDRSSIGGRDYVRLDSWAAACGFQTRWVEREKELLVTTKYSRLLFTVDARKIVVNSVDVWLSAAVALRNGAAYVAVMDLETAVHPILFPTKNREKDFVSVICIDAGHGGKDPGHQENRNQEKKFTLLLASELQNQLRAAGFKTIMTRTSDRFVDLPDRPSYARRYGADLFVSLHFNGASKGSSARGVETYCMTPAHATSTNAGGEGGNTGSMTGNNKDEQNMLLAYHIQKSLLATLPTEDRGVRRARFAVLRSAQMPAVLVEGGFMTEPSEAKKIYDPAYRRQMAKAITEGIKTYKRLVER